MLPEALTSHLKKQFTIRNAQGVSGGCINQCYKLETDKGLYFLKYNSATKYPGMFTAEAEGLLLMAASNTAPVPKVYETGGCDGLSYLLMQYLKPGAGKSGTMANLGRQLARMHQCTSPTFGLATDNYIGSLPQSNTTCATWAGFYTHQRLKPQLQMAVERRLLNKADADNFERLFERLPQLFPNEKPALLHGDLWSGNYLIADDGIAHLVDPAVYYGHREMDIAMSKLFGGFSTDFYAGYNEVFPLQPGWQQRIDLCNLYPLLVHVNLFGSSYAFQLRGCLEQYIL